MAHVDLETEFEILERVVAEAADESAEAADVFELKALQATAGTSGAATALVTVKGPGGVRTETATGNGPVHAVYNAIDKITIRHGELLSYSARSASDGRDAAVAVLVRVAFDGAETLATALDTDIIHASARAYLKAVNAVLRADASHVDDLEFEALTSHTSDSKRFDDWT